MKNALLLLAFSCGAMVSSAQIVFSSNDLPAIGDSFYFAIDNDYDLPGLQESGPNLIWDFSDLVPDDLALNLYLDPKATPFADNFPDANIALRIDFEQPSYSYFLQNDRSVNILGITANLEALGGEQLLQFINPQLFTVLPTSLGTNIVDTSAFSFEYKDPLIGQDFTLQSTTYSQIRTDASGEMKLPSGSYNALRQQIITERKDSLFTLLFGQDRLVQSFIELDTIYLWLSPASKGILLSTDANGSITYYDIPTPIANFDFTLLANGPVTFIDNSAYAPTSWRWDFGDGNSSTQQSPTHEFDRTGTYNVCLTVENEAGSNEVCQLLSFVSTSTKNLFNALPIEVFPNPAQQHIRFRMEGTVPRSSELLLYNQYGQMMQRLAFQADQSIVTKDWPTGLYYYQIIQSGQLQSSGQFSITR